MRRVIALLIFFILLFTGAGGCMRNTNREKKAVDSYLNKKYPQAFSYVSPGNDVWSSKTLSMTYEDQNGSRFTVKYNDDFCTDNYCSVLFDREIEKYFQNSIRVNCKVFASTQSSFFGPAAAFSDFQDYMKQCAVINLTVYVLDKNAFSEAAEAMRQAGADCAASVMLYCVTEDVMNGVSSYSGAPTPANILSTGSFWIENGVITHTSWGADS